MTKRTKTKSFAHLTREQVAELVGQYAAIAIERQAKATQMDRELQAVRDRYEPEIERANNFLMGLHGQIQSWAEAHRDEFGRRKSMEFLNGACGWRTGTHKLKTLAKWTWDRVLEKIKTLPAMKDYVRVKEEVNREAIIADRDHVGAEMLAAIGVKVVQDETFFVEPKLTEIETETKAASPAKAAA